MRWYWSKNHWKIRKGSRTNGKIIIQICMGFGQTQSWKRKRYHHRYFTLEIRITKIIMHHYWCPRPQRLHQKHDHRNITSRLCYSHDCLPTRRIRSWYLQRRTNQRTRLISLNIRSQANDRLHEQTRRKDCQLSWRKINWNQERIIWLIKESRIQPRQNQLCPNLRMERRQLDHQIWQDAMVKRTNSSWSIGLNWTTQKTNRKTT